jgi:ubiquinone/menaquinone biosynthesis C-methylase UbiE
MNPGVNKAGRNAVQWRVMKDRHEFAVGDVRKFHFPDNSFDVAYTTRVLINLPTLEEQITAINECMRIVRPGGKIVISEGFWELLCLLNALRCLKSLPPLVERDFNRYLKMSKLEEYRSKLGLRDSSDDFSSLYYLGSRFVRELVTDVSKYEGFTNPVNKAFSK